MQHKIGYVNRLKNLSYEEAEERVSDWLGEFTTKPSKGIAWFKSTRSTFFFDAQGELRAIYRHTDRIFWYVK